MSTRCNVILPNECRDETMVLTRVQRPVVGDTLWVYCGPTDAGMSHLDEQRPLRCYTVSRVGWKYIHFTEPCEYRRNFRRISEIGRTVFESFDACREAALEIVEQMIVEVENDVSSKCWDWNTKLDELRRLKITCGSKGDVLAEP